MMNTIINGLEFVIGGLKGIESWLADFANMVATTPTQAAVLCIGWAGVACIFGFVALRTAVKNQKLRKELSAIEEHND